MAGDPVAQIPTSPQEGLIRYMPVAHPDLHAHPGHVLVSYSRNVSDPAELRKNPYLYRPVFLEIPL